MYVKLSDRLLMSARLVEPSDTVADVGCDHAHTCIWLLQNGIAKKCIGMDVRTGPLKKAEENLQLYGCGRDTELRLSYGLDALKPGEAGSIVMSGMGGELIRNILEKDKNTGAAAFANPAPYLILQPQSHYWTLRKWLCDNGFTILDEDMCREDDKFYPAIKAQRTCEKVMPELSSAEIYFGPVLLKRRHPVLLEYLETEYRKKKYLIDRIGQSDSEKARDKITEVKEVFDITCEALKMCGIDIN